MNQTLKPQRIQSLDLLKGLVMIIMAIDHVRDYFHYAAYYFDPTDPESTTLPIFFTRFITNFCAPVFSLLAGVSAYMVGRKKTLDQLSMFLLKRGLWLVFVEVVIMNFGWHFDPNFRNIVFQVIWVLGVSMITLSLLVRFPKNLILAISCILIFGHNLLDNIHFDQSMLWHFLHERKNFPIDQIHVIRVGYPLIPWIAVMSLGYCVGPLYQPSIDQKSRKRVLTAIGWSALIGFAGLRWINLYGDPAPRTDYANWQQWLMSFLNLTKYPPSLLFLLVTLGVAFLFLASVENIKGKLMEVCCVFGRVPFFFYIIHIYLIHIIALVAAELTGFGWRKMILPSIPFRVAALKGFGFNLFTVYLIWILIIASLYPLCKWFDRYKQTHKEKWWLSYL